MNYHNMNEKFQEFNQQTFDDLEVNLKKLQKNFEHKQKKLEKQLHQKQKYLIQKYNLTPQKGWALSLGSIGLIGLAALVIWKLTQQKPGDKALDSNEARHLEPETNELDEKLS